MAFPFIFHAALFMLQHYLLLVSANTRGNITTDQSALLALKSHMILQPNHVLANNWLIDAGNSVCDWIGVTCGHRHRRVIALNISNMGVVGTIPPQLGNLTFLKLLDMRRNSFTGEPPDELGQLRRIKYINFNFNNFTGGFPSWTSFLPQLRFLFLANNSFTGEIPTSISNITKLELLGLQSNFIQGNIPKEINKLQKLSYLDLSFNQLSGTIPFSSLNLPMLQAIILGRNNAIGRLPPDICRRFPRLTGLYLSYNRLDGRLPSLNECSQIQALSLSYNYFTGHLPREIGNLTTLRVLFLGGNMMTGEIPQEIGNLNLLRLGLEKNFLKGSIPPAIFNMSGLEKLLLSDNDFSGNLPPTIGQSLQNLNDLHLARNRLTGTISETISNASQINLLDFSDNKFFGSIPKSLGNLRFLERLNLGSNNFDGESSSAKSSFWSTLSNCKYLWLIGVNDNPLNGVLPAYFGNLSASLRYFYAYNCKLFGNIPSGIGNLTNLTVLGLEDNDFRGFIPTSIKKLGELQGLDISNNGIQGSIPNELCHLKKMAILHLINNQISGPIPECFENLTSLRDLNLGCNRLTFNIPTTLWNLKGILNLNLSSNALKGHLSQKIVNLKAATSISLYMNQLSGTLPSAIGDLSNLLVLSLAKNKLQGQIPESIKEIRSLDTLDLSHNTFSGTIPKTMETLLYLKYFNVSYNNLAGEIPNGGPFVNFTYQSFIFNKALCGDPRLLVPPCHTNNPLNSKRKRVFLIVFTFLAFLVVTSTLIIILIMRHIKNEVTAQMDSSLGRSTHERFSYLDLHRATEGFNSSNLLGAGSFGMVYKGVFANDSVFAIKVFNLQFEGACRSFDVECQMLRNLRHRNLTKVITSCSNLDFKALVLQYLSNGSLEKWLYSQNFHLDINQRLTIMIDVACAIEYLHNGHLVPVVHCDLKPNNILLDEDMVAHVSDFGISKVLGSGENVVQTITLATIGYMAPEYGLDGIVSTKCDVYSFGIILMETFTKVKPTEEKFVGDFSLRSWVMDSLPDKISDVIDKNLITSRESHQKEKLECIESILKLALNCSERLPNDRMDIRDVVPELKKFKLQFLLRSRRS